MKFKNECPILPISTAAPMRREGVEASRKLLYFTFYYLYYHTIIPLATPPADPPDDGNFFTSKHYYTYYDPVLMLFLRLSNPFFFTPA